ncbi:MAG: hypothetical protein P8045_03570 [Candidatus Thiodiazotropha sp.]|jgi:hypothetical protein
MGKREKISLTLRLEFNSVSVTDLSKTPAIKGPDDIPAQGSATEALSWILKAFSICAS